MSALADRYASPEMVDIWSQRTRIQTARRIWMSVLVAQHQIDPGLVSAADLQAYSIAEHEIDETDHRVAEHGTGHETAAWIEVFNRQAQRVKLDGDLQARIHMGLTSCDITENVTAYQTLESVGLIRDRMVAVLARLGQLASQYRPVKLMGRTHGIPAQPITLGRRFAVCSQEMLCHWTSVNAMAERLTAAPSRGAQGAVGTSADMLALVGGDYAKLRQIHESVVTAVGGLSVYAAVGQTPPRSMDAMYGQQMVGVCSGPASLATTLRLMASLGLSGERPLPGQVGSTAMAHKKNPRYAERVAGLLTVVRGFASMLSETAGGVWNEGDVSDSATRRVALPGLFMATDGLLRTFMVALDRFDPDVAAMEAELQRFTSQAASGPILAAAVSLGADRELAHAAIREADHGQNLLQMAGDARLGLSLGALRSLRGRVEIGDAGRAVGVVHGWISTILSEHYVAAGYEPGPML